MKTVKTLASENPELVSQWHPTKNGDLFPENTKSKSNKKVWWICSRGHEWEAIVNTRTIRGNGCPYCSGHRATKENCFAVSNPELLKEWHPTKNGNLMPTSVTPNSSKRIWWICNKGHEWQTKLSCRSSGHGCPYCAGLYPTAENNLAVLYPELVKEIHPTKNGNFDPVKISPHSGKKIWWKCSNGHEWSAQIYPRTGRDKCGCPQCHKQYSLLELRIYAELLYCFKNVIWHDKSYGYEIDVFIPDKKIGVETDGYFWHKDNYDKDKEKTDFLISSGIKLVRLRALPLKKITDLDISYSEKLNQLDIVKLVFYNLFNLLHDDALIEYQKTTDFKNHKLYVEMLEKLKFPQKSIIDIVPELKDEWHPFKNELGPEKYSYGCATKVWWVCKNKHEWEAVINSRTMQKTGCPYCSGRITTKENCLAATNPELLKEWHPTKNRNLMPTDVCVGSNKKVWWKCEKGHEWEAQIAKRKIGHNCPYCSNHRVTSDNCLAFENPELTRQWHPTKNGALTAKQVTLSSGKKVWWKCEKGHEWEAAIYSRSNGRNCPHCWAINRKKKQTNDTISRKESE